MVERRPSVLGILVLSVVYWGALAWWQKDALFGTDSENQMKALVLFLSSFPYVGFVIWGTSFDLPENIAETPYGRMLKPAIWLVWIAAFFAYGVKDSSTVGFLLVGVGLLGLGAGLALACLMYSGSESSRLYALQKLIDVYPSITKPDGHVRFNQKLWTTTLVLIIYFMMTNVMIWGLSDSTLDVFSSFRAIMDEDSASIMNLLIFQIVTV